jgi:hypothetical protein
MKLKISGVVTAGDSSRTSDDDENGAVIVGGCDVVAEIDKRKRTGERVIIGIADERFDGDLFVETGWGYSEYTPMDSDELRVGSHDLIEILLRHDGKRIDLFVSDEPGNILDPSEWETLGDERER